MVNSKKVTVDVGISFNASSAENQLFKISDMAGKLMGSNVESGLAKALQVFQKRFKSVDAMMKGHQQKEPDEGESPVGKVVRKFENVVAKLTKASSDSSSGSKGMMMPLLGIFGAVVGILAGMKPVSAVLKALNNMFEIVFLPLGMIFLAMLMPLLLVMARILSSTQFINFLKITTKSIPLVVSAVTTGLNILGGILTTVYNDIISVINFGITLITNPLKAIKEFTGFINTAIKAVVNFFTGGGIVSGFAGFFKGISHLDTGGYIQSSGIAVVHKGESVVPAGGSLAKGAGHTFNITVNANTTSATTPKDIANEVMKAIESRVGRLQGW